MASPTQTIVGKGISNPLTTEDLLNHLPILIHGMVGPQKAVFIFSKEMDHRSELSCLKLTPLTVKLFPGGSY